MSVVRIRRCRLREPMARIPDISAPIIPGESAGGITLGTHAETLLREYPGFFRPSYLAGPNIPGGYMIRYRSASIDLVVLLDAVARITLHDDYAGRIGGAIGIGTSVAELEELCGEWTLDHEDHVCLENMPGVIFTVDDPDALHEPDGEATIAAITVLRAGRWGA